MSATAAAGLVLALGRAVLDDEAPVERERRRECEHEPELELGAHFRTVWNGR